jgi:hypothetical protein
MGTRSGNPDGFGYTALYKKFEDYTVYEDTKFELPLSRQYTVVKVIYRTNSIMHLYIDGVLKLTCLDTHGIAACEYDRHS